MRTIARRFVRGDDLLCSIRALMKEEGVRAGVILSGVGCVYAARIRDASGETVREVNEHCEIVSLTGTVSDQRCHIHIALSREDLSTVGGHLVEGTFVNTTCELIVGVLSEWTFGTKDDPNTGYDELTIERR